METETKQLTVNQLALYLGCEAEIYSNEEHYKGTAPLALWHLARLEDGNFTSIKPYLRKLSDITEEEMKELYSLVFNRQFIGNNITHRDIGKKEERWVLWSGLERLFIYKDGDIGADSDLSHYRVPAPIILQWQLSRGVDLFNWIEQGLAIDKTNL